MPRTKKSKKPTEKPVSIPSYRKIALTFLSLSLVLSLGILYLSTARAKIFITPKPKSVRTNFQTKICPSVAASVATQKSDETLKKTNDNCFFGQIFSTTLEGKETFPATQVEFKEKRARGIVTIINNYNKSQTLVRTTRLLSPQDILFRTDQTIQVPAYSQMQVQVYADQPGVKGEIPPTHFTIPGLWPGIQDKIYGESSEPMTGGLEEIKIVTEKDIKKAEKLLKEELTKKALEKIMNYKSRRYVNDSDELGIRNNDKIEPKKLQTTPALLREAGRANYKLNLTHHEILETDINAESGDELAEFEISMKLKLISITFDESQILAFAEKKLKDLVPKNMKLLPLSSLSLRGATSSERRDPSSSINESGQASSLCEQQRQAPQSFNFVSLGSYNLEEETAILKVSIQGQVIITPVNPLLDKNALIDKNEKELKAYLEKYPEISSVQVEFSPFWVRKTPFLKDRIEIQVVAF